MRAWVLSSRHGGLRWAAMLLVAALSAAAGIPRTVAAAPLPDLVVAGLTLTPATARAGDPIAVAVTLRNQGNGPADASVVGLYLGTSSGSPLTTAIPLGALAADGLAPQASLQISGSFIVPQANPGWLSVIAVADGAGMVVESHTANNRRAASLRITLADLTVSRLTLAPRMRGAETR